MNHHCACHFLLLQTFKSEGFFALYRGFVPQFLRLFPWNVIVSLNEFLSCRHFYVSLKQFFYYFLNTSLKPCSILFKVLLTVQQNTCILFICCIYARDKAVILLLSINVYWVLNCELSSGNSDKMLLMVIKHA